MKSYTDIEQSKRLAIFLSLDSADVEYLTIKETGSLIGTVPFVKDDSEIEDSAYSHTYNRIACWSLAALLDVLSEKSHSIDEDGAVDLSSYKNIEWNCGLINTADLEASTSLNPVDACVKMIIKLHEIKML